MGSSARRPPRFADAALVRFAAAIRCHAERYAADWEGTRRDAVG